MEKREKALQGAADSTRLGGSHKKTRGDISGRFWYSMPAAFLPPASINGRQPAKMSLRKRLWKWQLSGRVMGQTEARSRPPWKNVTDRRSRNWNAAVSGPDPQLPPRSSKIEGKLKGNQGEAEKLPDAEQAK